MAHNEYANQEYHSFNCMKEFAEDYGFDFEASMANGVDEDVMRAVFGTENSLVNQFLDFMHSTEPRAVSIRQKWDVDNLG